MATQYQAEPQRETLLVIHDFEARSGDELSLAKGDRIELIERDDDFGDGWYFGRHVGSTKTGLFPEVYTTIAPKGSATMSAASASNPRGLAKLGLNTQPSVDAIPLSRRPSSATSNNHSQATSQSDGTVENLESERITPPPLNTTPPTQLPRLPETPTSAATPHSIPLSAQKSIGIGRANSQTVHGEDSPVMNETLSVIDEHITDMHTPRHSLAASGRRGTNGTTNSGSEYSREFDRRTSYITGHETDEEESEFTAAEIAGWSPMQVSSHLKEIGVDEGHCDIFREQEITGEVLLGIDRESLFMKEFDLGSVGRRLRTWQKIKQLQDEVKGPKSEAKETIFGLDNAARELAEDSSNDVVPNRPSLVARSSSRSYTLPAQQRQQTPPVLKPQEKLALPPSFTPPPGQNSPTRPSAASIRELNHSRRHSSADYNNNARTRSSMVTSQTPRMSGPPGVPVTGHRKQSSFDRSWTMGGASNSRPTSSTTPRDFLGGHRHTSSADRRALESPQLDTEFAKATQMDLDRGYFSGGELDSRKPRNLLRKRESGGHSRNSSYTEEQRYRSATTQLRHSRIGSADSVRDINAFAKGAPSPNIPQTQTPKGLRERFRTSSAGDAAAMMQPSKNQASPTVTKLEHEPSNLSLVSNSTKSENEPSPTAIKPVPKKTRGIGLRAISDAVTGSEKALFSTSNLKRTPSKGSPIQSPPRTGSTTPSGSKSFESDNNEPSKAQFLSRPVPARAATRRKSKKETSAYIRGLEKKPPQEQMIGCDYSGWMKKKSTNLMTTWKPRLFVLRGRRLSYYYSENDDQEKGLIDISFHRVLPADNDRITGLHATLTGAAASPTSPQDAQTPTIASAEAASEVESSLSTGNDSMFIFKLMPPRMGLTKAVNFTKPTIHYFAVDNVKQGRLWMAALVKATIDRDDSKDMVTTYQQKTISLSKARQMRQRPPALMNLDEKEDVVESPVTDETGLNIKGVSFEAAAADEDDSGVSGLEKKADEAKKAADGVTPSTPTAGSSTTTAEQSDTKSTLADSMTSKEPEVTSSKPMTT
ncbi:MAG: hypothetical protein M4579_002307 [Chaenotheca gracillima]|nr:MAG: hypothetical protein M4579_002307 [Chaenotheca gracillima]